MKSIHLALCALLPSCSLSPQDKATLESNALKDANAALAGGLATGTWQGALAGAGAQVIRNHTPLTAAKNPVKVGP